MIRRLKLSYMLYNLYHRKELQHNVPIYKKLGLDKKYYSSISSADFENVDISRLGAFNSNKDISKVEYFKTLNHTTQESILNFEDNGFCIIESYLDHSTIASINQTIEELIRSEKLKFRYGNKLMFAIQKSEYLKSLWHEDSDIQELLNFLIKGEAKLFQSINFLTGSQQKTHSDSIHMTTFPLGGLLGVWLALEDIDLDNGPLHYYPSSHKLPYYLNKDYDNIGTKHWLGKHDYSAYERMLAQKIKEQGIQKKVFTAKKGDLFIWHANLMHGGEPHLNNEKTRKSMVLHYFDVNRVCYHEISQRPALLSKGV